MKRDFYQARVSHGVWHFKKGIIDRWSFSRYTDNTKPVVFFGVYSDLDVRVIKSHKGKKIIFFMGNDINHYGHLWKDDPSAIHVSYGPFKKKLEDLGVKVYNHVTPIKDYSYWKPVPLGDKIYVYGGYRGNRRDHYRWNEVVEPLIEEFGDRIIWTHGKTEQQLKDDYYSKCFAYVKPNPIGGSTAMWEMGHMGIRTFTQEHEDVNSDNIVNYSDLDDLKDKLKSEMERIGQVRNDVAEATKNTFNGKEWLSYEYYGIS